MRKRIMEELQVSNSINKRLLLLKFSVILFVSLFFMFYVYQKYNFYDLQVYEAETISALFNLNRIGNTLEIENLGLYVEITKECIGFKTFAFLFALILSTPRVSIKRKMILLVLTPFIALLINIFRISLALILVMLTDAQFYKIYDNILLAFLNSFIVILIWYFTTLRYVKPLKHQRKRQS